MSLSRGLKLKNYFTAFLICGAFLFILLPQNASAFNNYNKEFNGTLTAVEWNGLFNDYVNTLLPVRMNGPLGINVAAPNEGGLFLDVNGGVRATAFSGSLAGTLNAGNVSMGAFGSNTGGGNYSFPGNVGIGVANPTETLQIVDNRTTNGSAGLYVQKTGAIIGISYGFDIDTTGAGTTNVGGYFSARGATNNRAIQIPSNNVAGATNYAIYSDSPAQSYFAGNVGIGTTVPNTKLEINGSVIQANDFANSIHITGSSDSNYDNTAKITIIGAAGYDKDRYTGGLHFTRRLFQHQGNYGSGIRGFLDNTALYNNSLDFYTSAFGQRNVSRMYISSTGSVGIGTSTPGATLDVNGLIKMRSVTITQPEDVIVKSYLDSALASTTAGIITQVATSSFWQGSMTGNVYNANTGNIGIGTSTPAVLLHTYKATENALLIETGDTSNAALYLANSSGEGKIGYFSSLLTFRNAPSGNAQMVLDSAGNVGIGLTNPGAKLNISTSVASPDAFRFTDATNYTISGGYQSAGVGYFGGNSGTQLSLRSNGVEQMRINTSGNVGIGTTGPNDKLSIGMGGVAALAGSDSTGHNNANTYLSTDNYALANYGLVKTLIAGGSGSSVGYWTMNGNNIYNSNSGNVGIGTTNPGAGLAVKNGLAQFFGSALPSNGTGVEIGYDGSGSYGIMRSVNRDTASLRNLHLIGAGINFYSGTTAALTETSAMTIDTSGNVGIGTTAPGALLHLDKQGNGETLRLEGGDGLTYMSIYGASAIRGYLGAGDDNQLFVGALPDSIALRAENALHLGGSQALTMTLIGGNVGIGTTNPSRTLEIKKAAVGEIALFNDGTNGLLFQTSSGVGSVIGYNGSVYNALDLRAVSGIGNGIYLPSTGNVGIGTTGPNDKLSIGMGGVAALAGSDSTGHNNANTYLSTDNYALANYGLVKTLIAGGSGSSVGYWTMNGNNIYNSNSGNVGIGTVSPIAKLQISAGSVGGSAPNLLRLTNTGITDGSGTSIYMGYNATLADPYGIRLVQRGNPASYRSGIFEIQRHNTTVGDTDADWLSSLYINQSGNVGIGTTNPVSKLNIEGTNVAGLLTLSNSSITALTGDSMGQLDFYTNDNSAMTNRTVASIKSIAEAAYVGTDDAATSLSFITHGGTSVPGSSTGEKMRITSAGNVGIGTTAPGQALAVVTLGADSSIPALGVNGGKFGVFAGNGAGAFGLMTGVLTSGAAFQQVQRIDGTATAYNLLLQPNGGNVGIGTVTPFDKLSIGMGGVAAPAGSDGTGHNYTQTYTSTDNYALTNYGLVKTLIAGGSGSSVGYWTMNGNNIYNSNSGNVGIGTTTPGEKLTIQSSGDASLLGIRTTYSGGAKIIDMGQIGSDGFLKVNNAAGTTYTSLSGYSGTPSYFLTNVGIGTTAPVSALHVGTGITPTWSGATYTQVPQINNQITTAGGEAGYGMYVNEGTDNRRVKLFLNDTSNVYGLWSTTSTTYPNFVIGAGTNEFMRVQGTGNVGIGTTNPMAKLQVLGTTEDNQAVGVGVTSAVEITNSYTSAYGRLSELIFSTGAGGGTNRMAAISSAYTNWNAAGLSGDLRFSTRTLAGTTLSEKMRIMANGNVGIGTTAPNDKFSIGMGGVAAPAKSDGTGHNYTQTYVADDDYALTNYGLVKTLIAGGSGSAVGYWTMSGANIYNSNSGNVGIGTSTPAYKLDVNGPILTRGAVDNSVPPVDAVKLDGFGLIGNRANLYITNASASGLIQFGIGGAHNSAPKMTILSSGNVGIGTTDPGAYRLKVAGDVAITGALLTQTGSDFAEEFKAPIALEAGTVVVMGDEGYKSVKSCTKSYDKTVVGIVSDNPSIIAGRTDIDNKNPEKVIVAMMGVVSVKVTDINGHIEKGDLLTSSGVKGYAMKASDNREDRSGTIIGKALEDLNTKTGKIKVLVNLQ